VINKLEDHGFTNESLWKLPCISVLLNSEQDMPGEVILISHKSERVLETVLSDLKLPPAFLSYNQRNEVSYAYIALVSLTAIIILETGVYLWRGCSFFPGVGW